MTFSLAIQIGVGIWLGLMLTAGTIWGVATVADRVVKNRRYGRPWYRWLEA